MIGRPMILIDGTLDDCGTALQVSLDRLSLAVTNAGDLLRQAGYAGSKGDTADDLRLALAVHDHLLQQYLVKVRTSYSSDVLTIAADSSYSAYEKAAEQQGDTPCGISVTPTAECETADLAAAHRALRIKTPLVDALNDPSLGVAIRSYARGRKRVRRPLPAPTKDFKSLAANDRD